MNEKSYDFLQRQLYYQAIYTNTMVTEAFKNNDHNKNQQVSLIFQPVIFKKTDCFQ